MFIKADERKYLKVPGNPQEMRPYLFGPQLDILPPNCKLKYLGEIAVDGPFLHDTHKHANEVEVYMQISGTSTQTVNGETYVMNPGDVLTVSLGDTHRTELKEGESARIFTLVFYDPETAEELSEEHKAMRAKLGI